MGEVGNLRTGPPRLRRLKSSRAALVVAGAGALTIGLLATPGPTQADSVAMVTGGGWLDHWSAIDRDPALIRADAALGALFVPLAAPLFWPRIRNRNWKAHRALGGLAVAVMIVLPVTGIACAMLYPAAAVAGLVPNLMWLAAMLGCVAMAGRCVADKDILGHEAWVTRAAAMTAGITLSGIYEPIAVGVFGLDPQPAATLVFWLGQGQGIAAAEVWLRRSRGTLARRTALLAAMRR
ncbi:MAG TPA: DUF2306 domain-containing protein [Caulobacteraceae bacterium]|jgi:hypothetical protein